MGAGLIVSVGLQIVSYSQFEERRPALLGDPIPHLDYLHGCKAFYQFGFPGAI